MTGEATQSGSTKTTPSVQDDETTEPRERIPSEGSGGSKSQKRAAGREGGEASAKKS